MVTQRPSRARRQARLALGRPRAADELLERERERNARTWEVLQRLGVREGDELRLDFSFASAGAGEDLALARDLHGVWGCEVEVGEDGVTARTAPMRVGRWALDAWVEAMLGLGRRHGGGSFQGWTATVSRRPG